MAIELTDSYENADFITHGGNFHADDVYCIALFEYLFDNIKLFRLKLEDEGVAKPLENQIWFDIGGGEFDHHQKGGNGYHQALEPGKKPIPNASFGLVWKEFGEQVCRKYFKTYESSPDFGNLIKYVFESFDRMLVRGVDACDNGVFPMKPDLAYNNSKNTMDIRSVTVSCIISVLNPEEDGVEDKDNVGLIKAVYFARQTISVFLERIFSAFQSGTKIEDIEFSVDNDYKELVFDECRRLLEINDISKYIDSGDTFADNKLYNSWTDIREKYLYGKFGDDWRLADKNISGLVNGFCAEMEGINYYPKKRYDSVYFASLKDVFGEKAYYQGDDYEKDLRDTINALFLKITSDALLKISSIQVVKNAIMSQKGRILVVPEKAYWKEVVLFMPEAQNFWFVISPTQTNRWKVCPIKSYKTKNGYRKGFPSAWYGLRREQLESQRNIHGVFFIHDNGIMALCDDKYSAINLCKKAYGNTENLR